MKTAVSAVKYQRLSGWQFDRHIGSSREVLVHRFARTGARRESVVVADHHRAGGEARMKELERGECRLVQVDVDVHQREAPILESRETIRNPTAMELALWKRLQLLSRDPLVRFEVAGLPCVASRADFGVVVGRLRKTFERIAQMMRPRRIVQARSG